MIYKLFTKKIWLESITGITEFPLTVSKERGFTVKVVMQSWLVTPAPVAAKSSPSEDARSETSALCGCCCVAGSCTLGNWCYVCTNCSCVWGSYL